MPSLLSISELRNMNHSDLLREIREQCALVAKLRLGIKMKKEKDTAKYRREKKQLAKMQTVLTEKVVGKSEEEQAISVSSPNKS